MLFVLSLIFTPIVFTVFWVFIRFRTLMAAYVPTTLEKSLQHNADLIAERDKLRARIAELEEELDAVAQ